MKGGKKSKKKEDRGTGKVIFVPATPESWLKRSLDEDVKKSGLRDQDCGKVGDEREESTAAIRPIQEENM